MPDAPGRDPEYDRFGPWVLEVDEQDPLPPIFAPHVTEHADTLLRIKVPRQISRREARPGMDLYDFVVVLREHEVDVYEREDQRVRTRTIAYPEIVELRIEEQLLRGRLVLGVPDDAYTLPYNAVSKDLMRKVAVLIRQRYMDPGASPVALPAAPHKGSLSFHFEHLLEEETEDGVTRLLAAQEDVPPGVLGRNSYRRWLDKASGRRLVESLHVSDGVELRVIDRGYVFAYRWQTLYGRRETFIPLANLRDVAWTDHDDGSGRLTITTEAGHTSWAFAGDLDRLERYRGWLQGLSATRPR